MLIVYHRSTLSNRVRSSGLALLLLFVTAAFLPSPAESLEGDVTRAGLPVGASVLDDFSVNPLPGGANNWNSFAGTWTWLRQKQRLATSSVSPVCRGVWRQTYFKDGSFGVLVRVAAGRAPYPPSATLIFAGQSGGPYRYVTLTANSYKGVVTLGQSGLINGASFRTVTARTAGPVNTIAFYYLQVDILPKGGVRVYVNGTQVLSAYMPLVAGRIGLQTRYSQAVFDDFWAMPTQRPCGDCHSGSPPAVFKMAPNVMRYWDGSWWDAQMGGDRGVQQGGHGDPGGRPALTCTGATGCHDLNESPVTHRNGILEGLHDKTRSLPAVNTYHLKKGFICQNPVNPWDVQVTFDKYCFETCHKAMGLGIDSYGKPHKHEQDGLPAAWAMRFGTHLSINNLAALTVPVDVDLSSLLNGADLYGTCVSCHDPHGTDIANCQEGLPCARPSDRNIMLRGYVGNPPTPEDSLCGRCHK